MRALALDRHFAGSSISLAPNSGRSAQKFIPEQLDSNRIAQRFIRSLPVLDPAGKVETAAEDVALGGNELNPFERHMFENSDVVLAVPDAFREKVIGKRSIRTLQEWEGYVDEVGADHFVAVLADLTNRSTAKERATIPIRNVPKPERPYVRVGAIFQLVIGLAVMENGSRVNDHVIYFRRYTRSANSPAKKLAALIRATRTEK